METLIINLLAINAISFVLMIYDKNAAIKRRYRVSENTFFILAIVGGSPSILIAMYLIRHKTKHKRFTIGIPFILILQIIFITCLYVAYLAK